MSPLVPLRLDPTILKVTLRTLAAMAVLTLACGRAMETYEWLPAVCAPTGFPMVVLEGSLLLPGESEVRLPDRHTVSNGWGRTEVTEVIGPNRKVLPEGLDITWFSFTEDKFYHVHGTLDLGHLKSLFTEGVVASNAPGRQRYEDIIIGVAPGGDVSVWAAGGGAVTEVGAFHGEVTQRVDLDTLAVRRATFVNDELASELTPDQRAQLRASGVPVGRWAAYRERVRWAPVVVGSTGVRDFWISTFNGEREFVRTDGTVAGVEVARALPSKVVISWTDPHGAIALAELSVDEQDVFAAFAKLAPASKPGTLKLQVDLDNAARTARLSLRNDTVILPLKTHPATP